MNVWRENLPILRFVGLFALLFTAFQISYYEFIVGSAAFHSYLVASCKAAAALLGITGEEVTAIGDVLRGKFTLSVKVGCDGLQAMGILLVAVLVFPGCSPKRKLVGLFMGLGLVLILNVVRIASLFWAGLHLPGVFQTMHVHIWPAFLIFSALLFWTLWALWAARPRRVA